MNKYELPTNDLFRLYDIFRRKLKLSNFSISFVLGFLMFSVWPIVFCILIGSFRLVSFGSFLWGGLFFGIVLYFYFTFLEEFNSTITSLIDYTGEKEYFLSWISKIYSRRIYLPLAVIVILFAISDNKPEILAMSDNGLLFFWETGEDLIFWEYEGVTLFLFFVWIFGSSIFIQYLLFLFKFPKNMKESTDYDEMIELLSNLSSKVSISIVLLITVGIIGFWIFTPEVYVLSTIKNIKQLGNGALFTGIIGPSVISLIVIFVPVFLIHGIMKLNKKNLIRKMKKDIKSVLSSFQSDADKDELKLRFEITKFLYDDILENRKEWPLNLPNVVSIGLYVIAPSVPMALKLLPL